MPSWPIVPFIIFTILLHFDKSSIGNEHKESKIYGGCNTSVTIALRTSHPLKT